MDQLKLPLEKTSPRLIIHDKIVSVPGAVWLHVVNGVAASELFVPQGQTINDVVHAELVNSFVEATDGASIGWLWSNNQWSKPPELTEAQLAPLVIAAASGACAALTTQIIPDETHQNAYTNAAAIVGPSATVPTVDPLKTAFNSLASEVGMQPQDFANLVVNVSAASMTLSSILMKLTAAAKSATSINALAAALATFQSDYNAVIASLQKANVAVTVPPSLVVAGVNS